MQLLKNGCLMQSTIGASKQKGLCASRIRGQEAKGHARGSAPYCSAASIAAGWCLRMTAY